jgi:hypothetical protein
MLIGALFAMLPATKPVQAKIVAASMFKNGYAVVMRQIDIPSAGQYELSAFPQASLGTLWFSGADGVQLDSVQTVTNSASVNVPLSNLDEVLSLNVGKQVVLGTKNGDALTGASVEGTILSAAGDLVILKSEKQVLAIPKALISSISSPTNDLVYQSPQGVTNRSLRFVTSGQAGHISMISLERGLTWSPGYAVDISDKQKLTVVAKSTVINDLEDLKDVEARFVTGFPNIEWSSVLDPLTSNESVDQFFGLVQSQGVGSSGRSMLSQNAAAPAFALSEPVGNTMPTSALSGEQLEDLFFYRQPNVSLNRGDRAYYILFRAEASYKEMYTWDCADPIANNVEFRQPEPAQVSNDVWHVLVFKNTSGQPLTTGPATTFQRGQILGQDTMPYVSAGADVELRITKALDVSVDSSEEEVTRIRGAIKNPNGNYPIYDLVTIKGQVEARDRKAEPITLRIRHEFTGELVSADGAPDAKKTAPGLRDINPTGRITWTTTIGPGKKLSLSYTYKVYVKTPS